MNNVNWLTFERPTGKVNYTEKNSWEFKLTPEDQFAPIADKQGLPMFRTVFSAAKSDKVTVEATSLGIFELWCNGKRVGVQENGETVYDEFKPGWTDYRKTVFSCTYDLSDYTLDGENVLLAVCAPGWYAGRISFETFGDGCIKFAAEISVNGQIQSTEWKSNWGGRIRAADIWDGELYDFNEDSYEAISSVDYNICEWYDSTKTEHPPIDIKPFIGPEIRVRKGLDRKPATITIFKDIKDNGTDYGEIIVLSEYRDTDNFVLKKGEKATIDFGQEMVGVPEITYVTKQGTVICLRASEMLNDSGEKSRGNDGPKGSVYTINYRSAKAKAYAKSAGNAEGETYRPMFSFFGFRYFEISATEDVEIKSLTALVVGSDIPETGTITTSNSDVNQLISNIIWGQRSNYFSVPTDCPQRDERLGWTGDTQIFCNTAAYNANVDKFFHKWLGDARDSQHESGMYPDVIPWVRVVGFGGAAWADAPIVVAHVMWRMFGDSDIIRENYESFEKYMAWLDSKGLDGPNCVYGDWLAYEPTDLPYISRAYYAIDVKMMIDLSVAIGRYDRAEHYTELLGKIRENFRNTYFDEDGMLKKEFCSQTGYLLAFKANMFEGDAKKKSAKLLSEKIKTNGYKLSTGFVGSGILNETLAENGENNMAYSLLLQTENPSWLYSVYQGATTIWERWNSYTKATGFGDVGMNSFNHYAYGSVEEWMYRHVAGIEVDPENVAFKHFILQPKPDTRKEDEMPENQERITKVNAQYNSVNGLIKSAWEFTDGKLSYSATVPTGATLYLPDITESDIVIINGTEKKKADCDKVDGCLVFELNAGEYNFAM